MTKGEIFLFDTCLIGPVALLLNQYFSYIIPELIVLVASLVIIMPFILSSKFIKLLELLCVSLQCRDRDQTLACVFLFSGSIYQTKTF